MPTQMFPLKQIDANPFQVRLSEDPEHIQKLAADLAERGLLQIPVGRLVDGRVQLAFGHSRLAAFKSLNRTPPTGQWETFPIDLRVLSDQEMAEAAIAENVQRKDLSPIEKAATLKKYIEAFHVTQAEAGKLFGIEQTMVSNLMGLLEYPEPIQQRIQEGSLPLRHAWGLRKIARYFPSAAINLAGIIAKSPDDKRDEELGKGLDRIWENNAVSLERLYWPRNWKPEAAAYAAHKPEAKGAPAEPRACEGCSFLEKRKNRWGTGKEEFCACKPCYQIKLQIWGDEERQRASKKLGIPLVGEGEKVQAVWPKGIGYDNEREARKLVERNPSVLRLAYRTPDPDERWGGGRRKDILGTEFAELAATDVKEAKRVLALDAAEAKKHESASQSETARTKQAAKEEQERQKRARERETFHRARADVLWMLETLAAALAPQLEISGPILKECEEELVQRDFVPNGGYAGMHDRIGEIDERVKQAVKTKNADQEKFARREHILYCTLAHAVISIDWNSPYATGLQFEMKTFKLPQARNAIEGRGRKLELVFPRKWDEPPVHHTATNCWQCGRFGSNPDRITKGELSEGWMIIGKPEDPTAVYCPDHTKDHTGEAGKPLLPGKAAAAKGKLHPERSRRGKEAKK